MLNKTVMLLKRVSVKVDEDHTSEEVTRAKKCLEHCGASDISSTNEAKGDSPDFIISKNKEFTADANTMGLH